MIERCPGSNQMGTDAGELHRTRCLVCGQMRRCDGDGVVDLHTRGRGIRLQQ